MTPPDSLSDPLLQQVVDRLRAGPVPPLEVEQRVLDQLVRERRVPTASRGPLRHLARAAMVLLTLGGAGGLGWIVWHEIAAANIQPGSAGSVVRFSLDLPDITQAAVVGDFNDWDPRATQLQRQNGAWVATLTLRPGRYRYTFMIDGQRWLADPSRPKAVDDDFGTPTSILTVVN